jgi:hypothetical protein
MLNMLASQFATELHVHAAGHCPWLVIFQSPFGFYQELGCDAANWYAIIAALTNAQ